MITKIILAFVIVLLVLVVVIVRRPTDFRYARSATISAPASAIFPHVNELRQWEAWSPWARIDPAAKIAYEGPAAGVEASYTWSGNNEVGAGRSTIVESQAPDRLRLKLEFKRPFAATNDVEFIFAPVAAGTEVTWIMSGKNSFMGKAVGLVIDCEKMCGDMFTQGLTSLKSVVEAAPAT